MLKFLKKEANMTHTENGAVTYRSTQSECLDLFATIGALRRERDEEITNRFLRAYAEDADLAMKTLFFARDIRGGWPTTSRNPWRRTSSTLQSMDATMTCWS